MLFYTISCLTPVLHYIVAARYIIHDYGLKVHHGNLSLSLSCHTSSSKRYRGAKLGKSVCPTDSSSNSSSDNFNGLPTITRIGIDSENGQQTFYMQQPQPSSCHLTEPSIGSQHLEQPQQPQQSTQTHPPPLHSGLA